MDLRLLSLFTEQLRQETVGDPQWVPAKEVFEYQNQSLEVVVILKLIRASQGVVAADQLCRNGLFIDMGAIYRCVSDCVYEVHFLLENYPQKSGNVQKFMDEFFSKTIDEHLNSEIEPVPSKKIHSAMMRVISRSNQDEKIHRHILNIYKAFSGYIHAGYAHTMQMFGGSYDNLNFNIMGIKDGFQVNKHYQIVESLYTSVMLAIAFASAKLGRNELFLAVREHC